MQRLTKSFLSSRLHACFASAFSHQPKVAIMGAGMFGTAVAEVASFENRCRVTLYTNETPCVEDINKNHKNSKYHPNLKLGTNVTATTNLAEAVKDASIVFCVLPVQVIADVLEQNRTLFNKDVPFCSCSKEVVRETLGDSISYCKLAGPSFADEMAKHFPTAVVCASNNLDHAKLVQRTLSNKWFRVYTHDDVIGVEIAGALKNVFAIGAGMIEGSGFGLNTKTALLSRGNREMQKFVDYYGGKPQTLSGLAGMGDLVLTAFGQSSRNRTFGYRLAKGEKMEDIVKSSKGVVEGLPTLNVVNDFAKEKGIDMPITSVIHDVVHGKLTMQQAQEKLMLNPLRSEF